MRLLVLISKRPQDFRNKKKTVIGTHSFIFFSRRTEFISWSEKLKKRLEQFSSTVNNPDVILRRMELEFCAEVESKQYEFDWFIETCSCLQEQSPEGVLEEDEHNLTTKIEELQSIWSDLNSSTKGRIEKIKSLINVNFFLLVLKIIFFQYYLL